MVTRRKMHADELDIDESLVRRLLQAQFPRWADLPVEAVASAGTDNAIYRLGHDMAVRLPRIYWAVEQVEKEQRWLPGENARIAPVADMNQAATDLAQFIVALQRIDAAGGPQPGTHNAGRGVPLAERDEKTRTAIAGLSGLLDTDAVTAAWDAALQSPAWDGPPVWVHGDLQPGNLLVERNRLSAVIDFGCLGTGDPACDMMAAWTLFSGDSREVFRAALAVDDATWARARGWALSVALIALPYYLHTNPSLVEISWRAVREALADRTTGTPDGQNKCAHCVHPLETGGR